MKKLLQKAAFITRGLFYYSFYHFPYRRMIPDEIKAKGSTVTIRVEDTSYKLHVRVGEGGLAEDLYLCLIREYPNVLFFKKYLEEHAASLTTYVGIGSNIGFYAFLARDIFKKLHAKTTIYALEPVKSTFHRLLHNMALNNEFGFKSLNIGIGDKDTYANMTVMKQRNLSRVQNGTTIGAGDVERVEKIHLLTLKTLFEKYQIPPKNVLLRCDIEGYEYNLIVGNKNFLKQLKNAHIIMEFHPFYLHAKKSITLLTTLQSVGFKLDHVISCEPPYFVKMPRIIRSLLIKLFLFQYSGDAIGKIERYKTIKDLIRDVRDEENALYHYCNLHFYFSKP